MYIVVCVQNSPKIQPKTHEERNWYHIVEKICSIKKFRDFVLEQTFHGINFHDLCAGIMCLYCDINKFVR